MYLNILSDKQKILFPFLKHFRREFVLVGGTAIALQIGHRKSIDFDLFKQTAINKKKIKEKVYALNYPKQLIFEDSESIHYLVNDVKITFFQYPFAIKPTIDIESIIRMPDLLTLAAMKFYAMGRRAKWKDYVDIYFLLKNYFTISQVSQKASEIFADAYSEKLFRQQIVYFEDIDYSEPVEWIDTPIEEDFIKEQLIELSLKF